MRTSRLLTLLALAWVACVNLCQAQAQVTIQWLGQSTFKITSPKGKVIVTDPWLKANPVTPAEHKDLAALGKVDVLLVSHAHTDHLGDAPELARMHQVPLYAPGDLNANLVALGVLPPQLAPRFNKTGIVEPVQGITVTAVRAESATGSCGSSPSVSTL